MIRVYVNFGEIATLGIVNTGHRTKTKGFLYRVNYPGWAKSRYNHLKIYHKQEEPWTILVEKVLKAINKFNKDKEFDAEKTAYEYAKETKKKTKDKEIIKLATQIEEAFRKKWKNFF